MNCLYVTIIISPDHLTCTKGRGFISTVFMEWNLQWL